MTSRVETNAGIAKHFSRSASQTGRHLLFTLAIWPPVVLVSVPLLTWAYGVDGDNALAAVVAFLAVATVTWRVVFGLLIHLCRRADTNRLEATPVGWRTRFLAKLVIAALTALCFSLISALSVAVYVAIEMSWAVWPGLMLALGLVVLAVVFILAVPGAVLFWTFRRRLDGWWAEARSALAAKTAQVCLFALVMCVAALGNPNYYLGLQRSHGSMTRHC